MQGLTVTVSHLLVALYCLMLLLHIPIGIWLVNTAAMALCSWLAARSGLTLYGSLGLLAVSYFGQDVAHWLTGEPTFQSSYMENAGWKALLLQHTYYLLPCVLDAIPHMETGFLFWLVASNNVVFNRITDRVGRQRLADMRQWVLDQKPSKDHTTHWWFSTLPDPAKANFAAIAESDPMYDMFHAKWPRSRWAVEVIPGMNEIYVASEKHSSNSDTVFYMQHVDGPWYLVPFCSAFRCILAVNENSRICTHFPKIPCKHTLSDGDVVGFDFNREIHYIVNNEGTVNKEPRITLKQHYIVYPRVLKPLGMFLMWATTVYDIWARNLFLATIKPKGIISQFMAYVILVVTNLVFQMENLIGYYNLIYVALAAAGGAFVHRHVFTVMTSYMHYLMYIATYAQRENVAFGLFKRNVVFYKSLALLQLAYYYLSNFEWDPLSLMLIFVGYGVAAKAAVALGVDRTYFGVELGLYEPKWVTDFPYNCIPHPMILGAVVGLLGIHKMSGMRNAVPYLVPGHVALYLTHMAQEMWFDVYRAPAKKEGQKVQ